MKKSLLVFFVFVLSVPYVFAEQDDQADSVNMYVNVEGRRGIQAYPLNGIIDEETSQGDINLHQSRLEDTECVSEREVSGTLASNLHIGSYRAEEESFVTFTECLLPSGHSTMVHSVRTFRR